MAKIEKKIKGIFFKGKNTVVLFKEKFIPRGQNDVVNEETPRKSDFSRHRKFEDAMQVFAVHLLCRIGVTQPIDRLGKAINEEHQEFFTDSIYLDDPRFEDVLITGIIITTKEDSTSFQIKGYITTEDGHQVKLKSPPISTLAAADGGYNYPLYQFAKQHLETLLIEAGEWLAYRNPQTSLFDDPAKEQTPFLPPPKTEKAPYKSKQKADLIDA